MSETNRIFERSIEVMKFINREQLVDEAWKGFVEANGTDNLTRLAEYAKGQEEALIAAWRVGFFYALLSMEKGIIRCDQPENPSNN